LISVKNGHQQTTQTSMSLYSECAFGGCISKRDLGILHSYLKLMITRIANIAPQKTHPNKS